MLEFTLQYDSNTLELLVIVHCGKVSAKIFIIFNQNFVFICLAFDFDHYDKLLLNLFLLDRETIYIYR